GSSIIAIRTDHGQEFDNEVQFRAYCDAQGITHNFSVLRTPQSNRSDMESDEDPQEDPEEEPKEDPQEDPKKEPKENP
nr:retrovirus-related Pol polyprotein from transposon TNT 1-94 [Tanacetum cinerariifolium]